jgi:hypothetical protein
MKEAPAAQGRDGSQRAVWLLPGDVELGRQATEIVGTSFDSTQMGSNWSLRSVATLKFIPNKEL